MNFHAVDGALIQYEALRRARGQFVYVTNLQGFIDNEESPSIMSHLRSGEGEAVVVFAGDARAVDKLQASYPELWSVVGRRIELAPFTPEEFAIMWRLKMQKHFNVSRRTVARVEEIARERRLNTLDIETWCGRALEVGIEHSRTERLLGPLPD